MPFYTFIMLRLLDFAARLAALLIAITIVAYRHA